MKGYIKKRCRVDPKTGRQRTSGVWTVVYDEPVARGEKRRQKMKFDFRTRDGAEKWFTRKREQLERGFMGIDDKVSIQTYFEHWLRGVDVGAAVREAQLLARCRELLAEPREPFVSHMPSPCPAAHVSTRELDLRHHGEGGSVISASRETEEIEHRASL